MQKSDCKFVLILLRSGQCNSRSDEFVCGKPVHAKMTTHEA